MPTFNRQFWRAAGHLEHHLKRRVDHGPPDLPSFVCFQRLRVLTDRLHVMEQRRLSVSAKSVSMALHSELDRCQSQITSALEAMSTRCNVDAIPTQACLYAELIALATEFDRCEVDLRKGTLSVVTECIVLEDLDLGPFQISLDWKSAHGSTSKYVVHALEPSCPEYRSHITHPHVMNDRLCEGEAQSALRQALQSGRLTDFFQIINRVLHTYNSSSPYASIDDWNGTNCQDCGANIASDCSHCHACGDALCDDCCTCCSICETSACVGCLQICPGCENQVCSHCANVCERCSKSVCPECLDTTTQLCQECDNVAESEDCEPANGETADDCEAGIEVQPAGLGEVAVPA